MSTVLIIGAGATRAAAGSKPIGRCPPLDADFYEVAGRVDKYLTRSIRNDLEVLLGDFSKEILRSLETSTTYLFLKALDSKNGDTYHSAFLNLLELLEDTLAVTTNALPTSKRTLIYRFLRSELSNVTKPSDLTIITFNYDILIERALAAISQFRPNIFAFPGCYRLPNLTRSNLYGVAGTPNLTDSNLDEDGVRLYKLHGSLNWYSSHNSPTPPPSALTRIDRDLHIALAGELESGRTVTKGGKRRYLKPIIVPPISGKRGIMHRDVHALWKKAARALRAADRIVITGYSCPQLDLEARILLSENLRLNPEKKVYIVNPDVSVASSFVRICGVNHTTVYKTLKDWISDAPWQN